MAIWQHPSARLQMDDQWVGTQVHAVSPPLVRSLSGHSGQSVVDRCLQAVEANTTGLDPVDEADNS